MSKSIKIFLILFFISGLAAILIIKNISYQKEIYINTLEVKLRDEENKNQLYKLEWEYLISPINLTEISNKILELESSLEKPIFLMKNKEVPFFDTSISNKTILTHSISLINNKSIKDFQNKTNEIVEPQRFRGNIHIEGINAWEERSWVGKIININGISFKVEKNIPRCVAINLKPNTDDNSLNLLQSLKKAYNHFDMGIYLRSLNEGKIKVGNTIKLENKFRL